MGIRSVAGSAVALAIMACASRPAPFITASLAQCRNSVVATVSNPRRAAYDVYYQDPVKSATVIGEIGPGSTVTFPLPGEGFGRVYVRSPIGDGGGMPGNSRTAPEIRIRVHCPGT